MISSAAGFSMCLRAVNPAPGVAHMLRGKAACELTGMVESHAKVFGNVASGTNCVLSSRAVGELCTQLIEESYATKGFHVKAKSCTWGPMAGFVLEDPRFTKVSGKPEGIQDQRKAVTKAFHEGATSVDLYISDERHSYLVKHRLIQRIGQSGFGGQVRITYSAVPPFGGVMKFVLMKDPSFARPLGATKPMWSVHYGMSEKMDQQHSAREMGEQDMPFVRALRDPLCTIHGYRAAMTGDYDLFAVWAARQQQKGDTRNFRKDVVAGGQPFNAQQWDNRPTTVRTNLKTAEDWAQLASEEIEHVGNVSPRLIRIRDLLNNGIRRTGYMGGDMVHHSDEGGRPNAPGVEEGLPVIAFIPGQEPYGLETLGDLKKFIQLCKFRGYVTIFNPGWDRDLG
jgi:hypothetical protein